MANDINIDSLSIEIKSNSEQAASALDKLAASLDKLSTSVSGFPGLVKITNQLNRFSDAAQKLQVGNIDKLASSLGKLSKLTVPNFSQSASSLKKLTNSINDVAKVDDLSSFKSIIKGFVKDVKPLETLGKNTLSPFISTLKAIPKITESIDSNTLERFKQIIQEITVSIEPLASRCDKSAQGLSALNGIMQATIRQNGNLSSSNAALVKSYTSLSNVFTTLKVKAVAIVYVAKRLAKVFGSMLSESNAYVENLNLFTVAMGDATEEALEYANAVNKALGIDQSDWIRNLGVFKQIASGFGVITDKANLMATNLTQIGYDISSFYNINIQEAMQKVQSGISGELEPLNVAA